MHLKIKGLNRVRVWLADGRVAVNYYAWKSGPRLPGKPGSAEFIAAYNEAVAQRRRPSQETLQSLLDQLQLADDFRCLAARTRARLRQKDQADREEIR